MSHESRSLRHADPILAERVTCLVEDYSRRFAPWTLVITSVWRSDACQRALYAQGRRPLPEVNALRKLCDMPPIDDTANAHPVTWVTSSRHTMLPSRAVDLAVALDPDGSEGPTKARITWDDEARYAQMGELARRNGLVWGGDWKRRDMCHVELPRESLAQSEER